MVDRSLSLGTLFTANIADFVKKVDLIKQKVGQLNATMASVSKQASGMQKTTQAVTQLGTSMQKTAQQGNRFSQQLGTIGTAMGKVLAAAKTVASFFVAGLGIGAIIRGLQAGTQEIIDFDQALKNLQAITKATDAEVAGMGEVIKKVANETKFSTGEVAEGMVLLGQAGFSVQEAMQAMASVANLATGTLSDLKTTSDLLTTAIRAFGLSTVESARVADVMANAINRSKLTIDKLRIAFNFVGAAAAQAGLSIEETAGSMMTLANNGLRASTIGTGLRQVMSRLLAPNRKLREEFKEQGIALNNVNPAMVGWTQALHNLLPVLYDTEKGVINMGKAYQLFGLRGAQAAAILAKSVASGDFQKMVDYTFEVGAAARMAATQMEGLGVKLKNLADRLKLIAVALGEAGLTNVMKLFVDALRAMASAVADFIRSDVGQLVTAFAGWVISIWAVIRAFNILIKTISLVSKAITGRFLAALTSVGVSANAASSGFIAFSLSLVKIIGRFLKVGIIIGGLVTIIRHFVTAVEREIGALEKVDAKTQTVIQTLTLYEKKIQDLIDKKNKEQDVTKEHSKLIERFGADIKGLEEDYGKLDIALKDNVESLEENRKAIEALKKSELEKSIKQNIELIKLYDKQIERTNFWLSLWNFAIEDTVGWLKQLWEALSLLGDRIINTLKPINDAIGKFKEFLGIPVDISEVFDKFGVNIEGFWSRISEGADNFVNKYKGQSDKVESLTEAQRQAFVRLAKTIDLMAEGSKSIDQIVKELELLSGKKIDVKGIELINEALKKVTITLDEAREKWKETFDDLPSVFKEMYDKMDTMRKADFAKVLRQMAAEEAAFEDLADKMGLAEEERYAVIAAIRAKYLRKWEEDQEKEVKVNKDTIDSMLVNLDYFVRYTEEAYDKRTMNIMNHFLQEYDASTKSKKQLLQLEKEFSAQMEQAAKEREKRLSELGQERHKLFKDLEAQTVKEITKLNEKMYKDLSSQLKTHLRESERGLKKLQDQLSDSETSHIERLKKIRDTVRTDEEKWYADREAASRLFNLALETNDKELFKKAQDLAAGLARDVVDSQGNIIRSVKDTSVLALQIVATMHQEEVYAIKRAMEEKKKDIASTKEELINLGERMKEIKLNVEKLNSTELAIKMDESLDDMKDMYGITSKFKSEWDALKSKTITLTVKYKHVGAPPPGVSEPTVDQQAEEAAGGIETEKLGGMIRKKLGGFIRKAFGGKLPGYGGGDKVKALLEPGEFVVRKEAVAKYGENMFSALNSMSVKAQDMGQAVAERMGGIIERIKVPTIPVQKFATGGAVVTSSGQPPGSVNVYLQPKYMTGDRRSMRLVAADIKKALNDLDIRWGKR